jgi:hypothetical protein
MALPTEHSNFSRRTVWAALNASSSVATTLEIAGELGVPDAEGEARGVRTKMEDASRIVANAPNSSWQAPANLPMSSSLKPASANNGVKRIHGTAWYRRRIRSGETTQSRYIGRKSALVFHHSTNHILRVPAARKTGPQRRRCWETRSSSGKQNSGRPTFTLCAGQDISNRFVNTFKRRGRKRCTIHSHALAECELYV